MSEQDPKGRPTTKEEQRTLDAGVVLSRERVQKLVETNAESRTIKAQFKEELEIFLNPEGWDPSLSPKDMADILESKAQELRSAELRAERARREELYKTRPIKITSAMPPRIRHTGPRAPLIDPAVVATALGVTDLDAPPCTDCGTIMVRNGSCYKCTNCGSTSGCS